MIILQILLIPLVIFMMLGFVFVLGSSETSLSGGLEENEQHEARMDESIQPCEKNSTASLSATSAR